MNAQKRRSGSFIGTSINGSSVLGHSTNNFKVVIRVRPPLERELKKYNIYGSTGFKNIVRVDNDAQTISIGDHVNEQTGREAEEDNQNEVFSQYKFKFDRVYDMGCRQAEVYENTAREAVLSVLKGYNASIIAYGQTGTGKTFTMEGFTNSRNEDRGIIPRATEDIFNCIQTGDPKSNFLIRASYLQIYNEVVSDLLNPESNFLTIREDKKKGVYVEGLKEYIVRSPKEIHALIQKGANARATGATRLNELSSRSHAVFIIVCEQSERTIVGSNGQEIDIEEYEAIKESGEEFVGEIRQSFKIGKLNLVDLAGSERVRLSGATGKRLEEVKNINQSLACLGNVISALTDPKGRQHIPYRDSKLTRLLEDSLGGNCKTTMMAMVSPAQEAFSESLSTLKFAHRAKSIKNDAHINEDLDQRALLRKYERELKKLRQELEQKNKVAVDRAKINQLVIEKRKAEKEKEEVVRELQEKNKLFQQEIKEKRQLEERISQMMSKIHVGGEKLEDDPQFRSILKREMKKVERQYHNRIAELERDIQTFDEDKANVERYKQLLLKQRDIMIALTSRLNDRDETILSLQEELDAYDQHQKLMEEALERKTTTNLELQSQLKDVKRGDFYVTEGESSVYNRKPPTPKESTDISDSEGELRKYRLELNAQRQFHAEKVVKLEKIEEENRQLKEQLKMLRESNPSFTDSESSKQLMEQMKNELVIKEKEKNALKKILENKVKTMIDTIYRNVNSIENDDNREQLGSTKQVIIQLNQLINASVAALNLKTPSTPQSPFHRSSSDNELPSEGSASHRSLQRTGSNLFF